MREPIERWLADNEPQLLSELAQFLRIPSVSTRPESAGEVRSAAHWLRAALEGIGMQVEVHSTDRHPIVLAEWRGASPGSPTLLIYGHYDVQPADPIEEWTSPPFEPTIRNGRLFARGAADNKGQLWIHIAAIKAHLAVRGRLPMNVVLVVEGEEEVGSKSLLPFIEFYRDRLACDWILISDTAMFAEGIPSILASLRGIAYFELNVQGAPADLHSGMYGGVVANPAIALARIIATLHEPDGTIAIPGFYDQVRAPSIERRKAIAALPFDERQFTAAIGVDELAGELAYSALERLWARPTCEVNGILAGYTGAGTKTVLPSKAMAKVSFRLVADQSPEAVEALFARHVAAVAPRGVTASVRLMHGGRPWQTDVTGPAFDAARRSLESAFKGLSVIGGSGGTIPIVRELERAFNVPILLIGFGLPGENAHAPNEWLCLENFRRGAVAISALFDRLAAIQLGHQRGTAIETGAK